MNEHNGCLFMVLLYLVIIVASFLATAGLIYAVCWCFGWAWSWKLSLGVWAILFLIGGTIKSS